MRRFVTATATLLFVATAARAQGKAPLVEFEKMTWPEVKAALAAGKTTALFYTGGTEQRGPQNANGGHTLMATYTNKAIATKLGNAIAMPVLPYTPNNASATLPGTIGLTPELLSAILERISEQAIATGFKIVVLMNDHGGGYPNAYADVAKKLEEKYAPQGIHVFFADSMYAPAQEAMDQWLEANGYPRSSHAGIPDTAEMMYLDSANVWVRRDLIATAVGDPVPPRRAPGDTTGRGGRGGGRGGRGAADPNAPPRINNGISGDARRSTPELGKRAFDIKLEYAVRQIQRFQASVAK